MKCAVREFNVGPRTSLFHRFADTTDTNIYATGAVEIWKTRHKISVVYGYFCSVLAAAAAAGTTNAAHAGN